MSRRCSLAGLHLVQPRRSAWLCRASLLLVAAATLSVASFATNGVEPIDTSLQARARGGADVAIGDSALSQVNNPSSLANFRRPSFDFSGQVCFPTARWESPIDECESSVRVIPLGNAGVALPLDDRTTIGFALHSKAGLASQYRMRHLMIPWIERDVGADAKMIGLHFNIGHKLTDRLSIGFGVRGEVATSAFSMVLGPLDADFGRGYAYGGGFQTGLMYRATDDLTLGLAYRSPSWFGDVSGGQMKASLLGLLPVDLGPGRIESLRLAQKVTAGAAWDATDWLKLVGEMRWINYGNSSFDTLTVATDGALPLRIPLPMGYQDQWVFAVGAEVKLDEHWTWGVGYNYGTDPVRRSSLLPMGSTITQHHITTGLRYQRDNWWVGVGYILGMRASMDGGGYSRVPLGVDYGLSRIEQTQHSVLVGFGFSW
ncbi:MAG: outer membrane protein transport protein [Phycisphaerae bacterium]|nr:outer membrane protein transport protein [Phycisphaerae bacterium]